MPNEPLENHGQQPAISSSPAVAQTNSTLNTILSDRPSTKVYAGQPLIPPLRTVQDEEKAFATSYNDPDNEIDDSNSDDVDDDGSDADTVRERFSDEDDDGDEESCDEVAGELETQRCQQPRCQEIARQLAQKEAKIGLLED